jgi:hypothetical protein
MHHAGDRHPVLELGVDDAVPANHHGPGGPDPQVPALAARARRIGYVLALLVLVIVALMVFKPGA